MLDLKEGLTTIDSEYWKAHRKLISGAFRFDILNAKKKFMIDSAKEILDSIPLDGKPRHLVHEFVDMAGLNVGKIFFGADVRGYKIEG